MKSKTAKEIEKYLHERGYRTTHRLVIKESGTGTATVRSSASYFTANSPVKSPPVIAFDSLGRAYYGDIDTNLVWPNSGARWVQGGSILSHYFPSPNKVKKVYGEFRLVKV